jgi:hypothetical protein
VGPLAETAAIVDVELCVGAHVDGGTGVSRGFDGDGGWEVQWLKIFIFSHVDAVYSQLVLTISSAVPATRIEGPEVGPYFVSSGRAYRQRNHIHATQSKSIDGCDVHVRVDDVVPGIEVEGEDVHRVGVCVEGAPVRHVGEDIVLQPHGAAASIIVTKMMLQQRFHVEGGSLPSSIGGEADEELLSTGRLYSAVCDGVIWADVGSRGNRHALGFDLSKMYKADIFLVSVRIELVA